MFWVIRHPLNKIVWGAEITYPDPSLNKHNQFFCVSQVSITDQIGNIRKSSTFLNIAKFINYAYTLSNIGIHSK